MSKNKQEIIVATMAMMGAVVVTLNFIKPAISRISSRWYLRYLANRKKKKQEAPSDGSVSGLFIHPVKSLRAISLDEVELDSKGFVDDRRFMIVYPVPLPVWKDKFTPQDSTHRFLTQRQCPSLATIVAKIKDDGNTLVLTKTKKVDGSASGDEMIRIAIPKSTEGTSETTKSYLAGIWDDQVKVEDMGDEAAQFLQSVVDSDENCRAGDEGDEEAKSMYQNIRLVSHSSEDYRLANPEYTPSSAMTGVFGRSAPPVSLTDGFPILIACQSSLDQLNEKLKSGGNHPIPMSRFRPNIVITGTKPFEEDTWKTVLIGSELFTVVKACPRCKQSCTDQETGVVSPEPVATMKSFRALDAKEQDVFFAQNAIPLGNSGTVRVGDTVHVLQTGEPVYR